MHLPTSVRTFLALVALAGSTACLYIPPLSQASGRKEVVALRAGAETRQSLRAKLGEPDVVDLPTVQVWAWRHNRGSFVGYLPNGGVQLLGEHFRVLARYEGDRVVALETELEPPLKPTLRYPTLPAPTERIPLEPAPQAEGPRHYRAWVGPEGTLYACGWAGDLWARGPGRSQASRVAELNAFADKGTRNDTRVSASPGGGLLAISRGEWITLWEVKAGQVAHRFPALEPDPGLGKGQVRSTALFAPDGSRLAIGARRSSAWAWSGKVGSGLRVLDVATWKPLWGLPDHEAGDLQFSPDGTRLLVDGTLFEAATGRCVSRALPAPVRLLPGGRRHLLLGDELLLQETDSGRVLTRIPLRRGPKAESAVKVGWNAFDACVLADGTLLAAGNGVLLRCDLGRWLQAATAPAASLQPTVRLLPLRQRYEGNLMDPKWEREPRFEWWLSPAGDFILEKALVYRQAGIHGYWAAQTLRILDTRTLQTLWEEWPPKEAWGEARFLEDGRLLQTAGGEIRIWNLPSQP